MDATAHSVYILFTVCKQSIKSCPIIDTESGNTYANPFFFVQKNNTAYLKQWGLSWTRQWTFESHKSRGISYYVKHYQLLKNNLVHWAIFNAVLLEVGLAVYLFFVVRRGNPDKMSDMWGDSYKSKWQVSTPRSAGLLGTWNSCDIFAFPLLTAAMEENDSLFRLSCVPSITLNEHSVESLSHHIGRPYTVINPAFNDTNMTPMRNCEVEHCSE
jgi:hypothetical protein